MLLRFLGIILRVLSLEDFEYYVSIRNQFQTTFARGGGGVKSVRRGDCEYSSKEDFCPNYVQKFGLCGINLDIRVVPRAPIVFTRPLP
jgi:hypothetical protein